MSDGCGRGPVVVEGETAVLTFQVLTLVSLASALQTRWGESS